MPDEQAGRDWDRLLADFSCHSYLQGFRWGAYKATQRWTPLRLVARGSDGRVAAMAQMLIRAYPARSVVAWCPGGIVGPVELWSRALLDEIASSTSARRLYCRAAFARPKSDADVDHLSSIGWTRPPRPIGASRTLCWDLRPSDEELLKGLTGNWRHNLNRALKRGLDVFRWHDATPAAIGELFAGMAAHKRTNASVDVSRLTALLRALEGSLLIYGCREASGTLLAVRACVYRDEFAWDLLAATSPEGRRCYASYVVLWDLIGECRRRGVTTYDLSGVDAEAARGVYDFKQGTGARPVDMLGEWEWSSSALMRHAVNLALGRHRAAALP